MSPDGPAARTGLRNIDDIERMLAAVRKNGVAVVEGLVCPGVASISAPVFAQGDELVAPLTVVGVQGMISTSRMGEPAQTLVASAKALSQRLELKGRALAPPPAAMPAGKPGRRPPKTRSAATAGDIR